MQKLIKRKMHYETIMPVEAYHPEDDTFGKMKLLIVLLLQVAERQLSLVIFQE